MKKILFMILLLFISSILNAHKLNIFAYYEDGKLNVESFFSDGTGCKNCEIKIIDNQGKILYSDKLDDKGQKVIPIKLNSNVKIKVIASIGHESVYNLKIKNETTETSNNEVKNSTSSISNIDTEKLVKEIKKEIGKELEKQLRPIIMELAKIEGNKTEKIVAGIGYIFGIFGLFMLFYRRKK